MAIESTIPRSRRALLAASLGGLAALVAGALGRPAPARAGDDGDVVLGATNAATTTTRISNPTNGNPVFRASSSTGIGVYGQSGSYIGVYGYAASGSGVNGGSESSYGVDGQSVTGVGVRGTSWAADRAAVAGRSIGDGTGLLGHSGSGALPAALAKTGVYGYAVQDSASRGVYGRSNAGWGVHGYATSGIGVRGATGGGVGVYASGGKSGSALVVNGRAQFTTAGRETILSGSSSSTAKVELLGGKSIILATLMSNPGAGIYLHRVAADAVAGNITVHLSGNATANTDFAWFVIG